MKITEYIFVMSKMDLDTTQSGRKSKGRIALTSLAFIIAGTCFGYTWTQLGKIKNNIKSSGIEQRIGEIEEPIYTPLDTFTVSLKPGADGTEHVLCVGLTLSLKDPRSQELLRRSIPVVRSRLLMLFSQQMMESLSTDEGKKQLIQKVEKELAKPLSGKQTVKVTDVLFNVFILR
ncbi:MULTISPECIES: flagellar basal body-associated FliL family protein [unclassified Escherichia]|uniref:flagellar basal body-associated FliL family protein n=1 Tax=unclassified Escherichia TaxID=2608889 RepID=UPI001436815A|nr:MULTISPECIES: flagellar basal body-associated FliL family protein [unclassified Escherichia]